MQPSLVALDVTVISLLLPSYLHATADSPAGVLAAASAAKALKHGPGCHAANRAYRTLAFSFLGAVGPTDTLQWIHDIYHALSVSTLHQHGTTRPAGRRRRHAPSSLQS